MAETIKTPAERAILVGLALLGKWLMESMVQYTKRLFEMISGI